MYREILLAYDGSPDGREALSQVARLASLSGAKVRLLAVIDPVEYALPVEGMSFANETELTDVESVLEEGLSRLRDNGLVGSVDVKYGRPAEQIAQCAREINADLIVIGHRQQGAIARWLHRSVGASVLNRAPCSVLVAIGSKRPG